MMYAAHPAFMFSRLQITRPIHRQILPKIIQLFNIHWAHNKVIWLQIALFIAIFATLSVQFGLHAASQRLPIYVSALVQSGSARIVVQPEIQAGNVNATNAEYKWLFKGDSVLIKAGDRIEALDGVIVLTYVDGSVEEVTQTDFTVPELQSALQESPFSFSEWLTRIIQGLNQPIRQSVNVASVLG
ncbi:MAG: hypothetical protein KDE47_06030 [Caldilineaceae bacterium]|nr:hypothetical protein [Caldilineaceae bacterium]